MSTAATHLQEPVTSGAIASVNFFNGRLLTGEDLSREQLAGRDNRLRLGRAIGTGVASGLEVAEAFGISTTSRPVLRVEPGLAINADGVALELADRTDVLLVQEGQPGATSATELFADCGTSSPAGYAAGFGVYVLTIAPVERGQGRAPVSGLGNTEASCNTNVVVEGVVFRLVRVKVAPGEVTSQAKLRSHVAARAFGVGDPARNAFFGNPFGPAPARYGLVDELRDGCIGPAEVPLAALAWTATGGLEFVDLWSVRRRIVAPAAEGRWPLLVGDRARAESEAMYLQFEAQALELVERLGLPQSVTATSRFEFLPPVGIVPIFGGAASRGFDAATFFGAQASTQAEMTDARLLRALLAESVHHEPIAVGTGERIQLYILWENVTAARAGTTSQLALVFAKETLPYRGIARFGEATWDLSRFAPHVM